MADNRAASRRVKNSDQANSPKTGAGLALCAALLFASPAQVGAARPAEQDSASTGTVSPARGAQVYDKYCAICHAEHGEGYLADNANALSNQDFLPTVSDEFLRVSIARGRPDTAMAAHASDYGGPLDNAEIDSLVLLLRSWQREPMAQLGNEEVLGDPVAGRETYDQYCAACHGEYGEGVNAISLENPEFLAIASDAQLRVAIAQGRRGTPMAAYGELLSDDAIDDLVALIRSWQREPRPRLPLPDNFEFPPLVLNPDGPPPQFNLREGRYVSAGQLDAAMRAGSRLILLDARPPSDWFLAHIPGAVPAPAYDPNSIILRLPEDGTWIVSYCACPHSYSNQLTDALRGAGFDNTVVLDEGVRWWQLHGYPIEYGP
jgi:cytochrome c oxidase cbb3-type subunit 3/ubiquinol-cytochrome c reductase cytochrome c subunit